MKRSLVVVFVILIHAVTLLGQTIEVDMVPTATTGGQVEVLISIENISGAAITPASVTFEANLDTNIIDISSMVLSYENPNWSAASIDYGAMQLIQASVPNAQNFVVSIEPDIAIYNGVNTPQITSVLPAGDFDTVAIVTFDLKDACASSNLIYQWEAVNFTQWYGVGGFDPSDDITASLSFTPLASPLIITPSFPTNTLVSSSVAVCPGSSVDFEVNGFAGIEGNYTFDFIHYEAAGATYSSLQTSVGDTTLTGVTTIANGDSVFVVITDNGTTCVDTTNKIDFSASTLPVLQIQQPGNILMSGVVTQTCGGIELLMAADAGGGALPVGITYRWLYDDTFIPGEIGNTLILASFDAYGGAISLEYTDGLCTDTTPYAEIEMWPTPDASITKENTPICNTDTGLLWVNPIERGGLVLDGLDDFLRVGHDASVDFDPATSFTIEAWVYPITSTGIRGIVSKIGGGRGYEFAINNSNRLQLIVTNGGISTTIDAPSATVILNQWNHVAVTVNRLTLEASFAIGGSVEDVLVHANLNQSFDPGPNGPLDIGALNGTNFFGGKIDEVRIWSAALNETGIDRIKDIPAHGTEPFLEAYMNMDDSSNVFASPLSFQGGARIGFGEGFFNAPPTVYSWTGPAGFTSIDNDSIRVTLPGTYGITVDNSVCQAVSTIDVGGTVLQSSLNDTVVCVLPGPGTPLTVTAQTGTNFNYNWEDGNGTSIGPNTNVIAINITQDTTITLEMDSMGNCTVFDTMQVTTISSLVLTTADSAIGTTLADTATMSWDPVGGATAYEVAAYPTATPPALLVYTPVGTDTTFDVVGSGTGPEEWTFVYRAISACGTDTVASRIVIGSCTPLAVSAINDSASVTSVSALSVSFAWNGEASAEFYEVFSTINGTVVDNWVNVGLLQTRSIATADGDTVCFAYRARTSCDTAFADTSCVVAFDCNAGFSGLRDTATTYCTSSFNDLIEPDSANNLTGSYFFEGPGVNFGAGLWYFDPQDAGPGTHIITMIGCYGSDTITDTVKVLPAPCAEQVDETVISVPFGQPQGIYTDCRGQIYFSEFRDKTIVKIDTFGLGSTIVGVNGVQGFEDGLSNVALLQSAVGVVVHPFTDVLYFADFTNHAVRKYDPITDSVVTIAGGGPSSFLGVNGVGLSGDSDNPADAANNQLFTGPFGLAINATADTLYVSDQGNRKIKAIALSDNSVTTVAGTGALGITDGDAITQATFANPTNLSVQGVEVFIADDNANQVRILNVMTDSVTTLLGTGGSGFVDGALGTAQFNGTIDVASDGQGTVFLLEKDNCALRLLNTDTVTTVIGDPGALPFLRCGPNIDQLSGPTALSVYVDGFIDIVDTDNDRVVRWAIEDFLSSPNKNLDSSYCITDQIDTLNVNTVAGFYSSSPPGFVSDNGTHWVFDPSIDTGTVTISFSHQVGACAGSEDRDVYVAPLPTFDLGSDTTICGVAFGNDSLQVDSTLGSFQWSFRGLAATSFTALAGDTNYFKVIDSSGTYLLDIISPFGCTFTDSVTIQQRADLNTEIVAQTSGNVGLDTICFGTRDSIVVQNVNPADPGLAAFQWNTGGTTQGIRVSNSGDYTVVVTDSLGCIGADTFRLIEKNKQFVQINIDTTLKNQANNAFYGEYVIETLAGRGNPATIDGSGLASAFNSPWDVYFWRDTLYVTEQGAIRKVALSDSSVNTIAGGVTFGDSLPATDALLGGLRGITVDGRGRIIFADGNGLKRLENDSIYYYAGNVLFPGFANGSGLTARFNDIKDIARDNFGNIYVADYNNHLIRKVTSNADVTTLIGSPGVFASTDGQGTSARVNWPFGVAFDPQGSLFIVEEGGRQVAISDLDTNVVHIAGTGALGFNSSLAGGIVDASSSSFNNPWNAISDASGAIYFTEGLNNSIRVLLPTDSVLTIVGSTTAGDVDGIASLAGLSQPRGITMNPRTGVFYIGDTGNNKIKTATKNRTITVCPGTPVNVNAEASSGANYTWIDRSSGTTVATAAKAVLPDSGWYVVRVDPGDGCSVSFDSVLVEYYGVVTANIDTVKQVTGGPTTIAICPGDTVTLLANPVALTSQYQWATLGGTVVGNDTLLRVGQAGTLELSIRDLNGCITRDTIQTTLFTATVSLGNDIALCAGDCQTLDAGAGFTNYLWNDSTTNQTLEVCAGGIFDIEATTADGCIARDTIDVQVNFLSEVRLGVHKKYLNDFAGSGTQATTDNMNRLLADFSGPVDVTVARNGDVYVSQSSGHIRKIDIATNEVTTVLSLSDSLPNFTDLSQTYIAMDKYDNLYITTFEKSAVFKLDASNNFILYAGDTTVAPGYKTGMADTAQFLHPLGISVDEGLRVYISDAANHVIRVIDPRTHLVSEIGVALSPGASDGLSTTGTLVHPGPIDVNINGDAYFGQTLSTGTPRIRRYNSRTDSITTTNISGNNETYATGLRAMTMDRYGNLAFAGQPSRIISGQRQGALSGPFIGDDNIFLNDVNGFDTVSVLHQIAEMAYDPMRNRIYVVDGLAHKVKMITDSFARIDYSPLQLCAGDSALARASVVNPNGNLGGAFLWNTGSTGDSSYVSQEGYVTVQYTDPITTCISVDSAFLDTIALPRFASLTSDSIFCYNDTVQLFVTAQQPGDSVFIYSVDQFGTETLLTSDTTTTTWNGVDSADVVSYRYIVDNNVCSTDSIVQIQPTDLLADIIPPFDTICFGDSILLDATVSTGGAGGFTYRWFQNPANMGTISDSLQSTIFAAPGNGGTINEYGVRVEDAAGCFAFDTVEVFMNSEITIRVTDGVVLDIDTIAICGNGLTPQISNFTAVVAGGTPNSATLNGYDYQWYIDTLRTAPGVISFSTPTSPATGILSNTPIPDTVTVYVDVTDSLGCVKTDSIILKLRLFSIDAMAEHLTVCPNFADTLNVVELVAGSGGYRYQWFSPAGFAGTISDVAIRNPFVTLVTNTEFTVSVIDTITGCSALDSVRITVNPIIANAGNTSVICDGDTATLNGSLSSGAVEFTNPAVWSHHYLWTNIGGSPSTFVGTDLDTGQVIQTTGGTPNSTTTYQLLITDSIGCQDSTQLTITWNDAIVSTVASDTFYVCHEDTSALQAVTATGGRGGAFDYDWNVLSGAILPNTAGVLADSVQSPLVHFPVAPTSDTSVVQLVVADSLGCLLIDTAVVINNNLDFVTVPSFDTSCAEVPNQLRIQFLRDSNSVGGYTYDWYQAVDSVKLFADSAKTLPGDEVRSPIAFTDVTQIFEVRVTDNVSGCSAIDSATIFIFNIQPVIGTAPWPDDTLIACFGDNMFLTSVNSTGGTFFDPPALPYQYKWFQDSTGVVTPSQFTTVDDSTIVRIGSNGSEGLISTYILELTDKANCTRYDTTRIRWNTQILPTFVNDTVYVCTPSTGTVEVDLGTTTGGITPYTYQWTVLQGNATLIDSTNQTATISSLDNDTSLVMVTLTDSAGCTGIDTMVVIGVDFSISAAADFAEVCLGVDDTLRVTFLNDAVGPFTYAWSPNVELDDATSATPVSSPTQGRIYNVDVVDTFYGCSASDTAEIKIIDLVAIAGNARGLDTLIVCAQDPSVVVSAQLTSGGTQFSGTPYSYAWTAGTEVTLNSLSGDTVLVTENSITRLDTSLIIVTVTDSVGCVDSDSAIVYWNSAIAAQTQDSILYICNDTARTLVATTATGGTAGYVYDWSLLSSPTAASFVAGTSGQSVDITTPNDDTTLVMLTVTDSVGCVNTDTMTVLGLNMQVTASAQHATICSGLNDSLAVSIDNDFIGGFTYLWTPSDSIDNDTSATPVVNPAVPTTYTVLVFDTVTGCYAESSVAIDTVFLNAVAGATTGLDTLLRCFGDVTDLSLDASLTNRGTPSYTYSWSSSDVTVNFPDAVSNPGLINRATAGDGTISTVYLDVTDSIGCISRDSLLVLWNSEIIPGVTYDTVQIPFVGPAAPICVSVPKVLDGTVTGGTGNYSYLWALAGNPDIFIANSSQLNQDVEIGANVGGISNIATFTVTDQATSNGTCSANTVVTIVAFDIDVDLSIDFDTVCPGTTVELSAVASNGIGLAPEFSFDNGGSFSLISLINTIATKDSSYVVTVRDDSTGCLNRDTVDVTTIDLIASYTVPNPFQTAFCFDDSTNLVGSSTGGYPRAGIAYQWFEGVTLDDTMATIFAQPTNVGNTIYRLVATDSLGCTDDTTVTITRNDTVIANAGTDAFLCIDQSLVLGASPTGSYATLPSALADFNYSWTGISSSSANPTFTPNAATDTLTAQFIVTVTDATLPQCVDIDTIDVVLRELPRASFAGDSSFICANSTTLLYASGDSLFTYPAEVDTFVWTNITNPGSPVQLTAYNNLDTARISTGGIYMVFVSDTFGCVNADTIDLSQVELPEIKIAFGNTNICGNEDIVLNMDSLQPYPPKATDTLEWILRFGDGFIVDPTDTLTSYVVDPVFDQGDSVRIIARYKNECAEGFDSVTFNIIAPPVAQLDVTDSTVNVTEEVTFTTDNSIRPDIDNPISYDLEFNAPGVSDQFVNGLAPTDIFGPFDVTYLDEGDFTTVLTVTDDSTGCFSTDTITMAVNGTHLLFIPNVFSPNATNVENQTLKMYGFGVSDQDFIFTVYNRWGEIVYEQKSFTQATTIGWTGQYLNTGEQLDIGVYTYIVRAKYLDGTTVEKVGTITLLR